MDVDTLVRGSDFTYSMSPRDMLSLGNYCEVLKNKDVTWPPIPKGRREVAMPKLHYFGKSMAAYEAVKEIEKLGLRPATIYELLRFGAERHDYQPKHHEQIIFALDPDWWLGSIGLRVIPALVYWGRDKKWELNLSSFRWHAVQLTNVCFAVVEK